MTASLDLRLINVAIEELVRQRYELPAFSTLDRLACHIRSIVNTRLFRRVARKLYKWRGNYLSKVEGWKVEQNLRMLD